MGPPELPPANPFADRTDDELLAECEVEARRASGPGGQHRNKVESAIRLRHRPTDIVVNASERRSQSANLRLAVSRLRERIAKRFHRDPPRVPTRKGRGVRGRELDAKRRQGETKRLRRPPGED